jgi:hypothetical protein
MLPREKGSRFFENSDSHDRQSAILLSVAVVQRSGLD